MPRKPKKSLKAIAKNAREAKRRKLEARKQCAEQDQEALEATPISASSSKITLPELDNHSEASEGYRLIDLQLLSKLLFENLRCAQCSRGRVRLTDIPSRKQGLATLLVLHCNHCGWTKDEFSSKRTLVDNSFDVNIRAVYACSSAGLGLSKIQDVFCGLNMPKPFSSSTYNPIITKLCDATKSVSKDSMNTAACEIRNKYEVEDDKFCKCTAMFDGTWMRRGHSSKYGVVTAISIDNTKVLDVSVKSSVCAGCRVGDGMDKDSENYEKWYTEHIPVCKKNHDGSAQIMEMNGVLDIYKRSRKDRRLEYTGYVGDGDSKSYANVVKENVYGSEINIVKKECVGHVQKRCGKRLRDIKKKCGVDKLSDGKSIGGRGRLTEVRIDELQTYYGLAIRRNKGDLEGMKRDIWATLDHVTSTDDAPHHTRCPPGESSWCRFRRFEAMKDSGEEIETFKHSAPLPDTVVMKLLPVYKALSDDNLLSRCLDGYTQNACESLNSMIWNRCPKEKFCGPDFVELGVHGAVCSFNDGRLHSSENILKILGVPCGKNYILHLRRRDQERINLSIRRADVLEKRKVVRRSQKEREDTMLAQEGTTYSAGAGDDF